jgi:hypothetical protein
MKKIFSSGIYFIWVACLCSMSAIVAGQDSNAAQPSVYLRYFVNNNNIQYLLMQSRIKEGKKFEPLPQHGVQLYLDSISAENLITKTTTDEKGLAKVLIPASMSDKWNSNPKHQFIGILDATAKEDERTSSLEITKAKIELDTSTADGIHTITVLVKYFQNDEWLPAKEVEMKIGVNRSASILSAGDEDTYTTDSTGTTAVEFKKINLPGDQHGNFVLVAKVEDNELYGNLLVEKTVPWGIAIKEDKTFFDQRTLWSTRFRTPKWLLFMAYSIIGTVWSVIIYLVFQIIKIKKLGKENKRIIKEPIAVPSLNF